MCDYLCQLSYSVWVRGSDCSLDLRRSGCIRIEQKVYIDNGNKIVIRFPEVNTNTVTCDDRTMFQTEEGIWVSETPVSKKLLKAITAILKWNITDTPDLHQMMEV